MTGQIPGIDQTAADSIAERLGDLPLAISQAVGYLDETNLPASKYADLLASRLDEMLDQGQNIDRTDITMANLWSLTVDRLRTDQPAAVELLEFCAVCDVPSIPLALFTLSPRMLDGCALAQAAENPVKWAAAVGALVGYNLARRDNDQLTVHRLIAAARDAPCRETSHSAASRYFLALRRPT
jgi:hypothetical protein